MLCFKKRAQNSLVPFGADRVLHLSRWTQGVTESLIPISFQPCKGVIPVAQTSEVVCQVFFED
jgi:hypothetical protein